MTLGRMKEILRDSWWILWRILLKFGENFKIKKLW